MSQDRTQTNEDFTALATAALVKARTEASSVAGEAQSFVTGLGPNSSTGYVQPGATDVSDSLGG